MDNLLQSRVLDLDDGNIFSVLVIWFTEATGGLVVGIFMILISQVQGFGHKSKRLRLRLHVTRLQQLQFEFVHWRRWYVW